MVSVGVIDMLVSRQGWDEGGGFDQVVAGARAGQRLAAANCAFAGARGVFQKFGASAARTILDEKGRYNSNSFPVCDPGPIRRRIRC